MALLGFADSPVASLWNRLGSLIYEHGEPVYAFQGLRAFKDKFHPQWEPRYLAYPGGLRLPLVLADTGAHRPWLSLHTDETGRP
ncbi:MAG: phosphatidylglycerol lysyltransferase domain-containing protein [Vicinamibacterales bacterium]